MSNSRFINRHRHLNIMCSCDDNYIPCCGIMLTSLFENNKDSSIDVFILSKSNDEEFCKIKVLASKYKQNIQIINIEDSIFDGFPIKDSDHITKTTYCRLFAAVYLPQEIDKVLYLDCDIIVNKSITNLYETDISSYSAGVVIDCDYYREERNQELGLISPNVYFNAGVLLLNLRYWRENHVLNKFILFNSSYTHSLNTHDQDILNAVLQNEVLYLPITYNFQTLFLFSGIRRNFDEKLNENITNTSLEDIAIIHYCTPVKPWNCWHFCYPFHSVWTHYQNLSLWKNWKQKQPFQVRFRCKLLSFASYLGIKRIEL